MADDARLEGSDKLSGVAPEGSGTDNIGEPDNSPVGLLDDTSQEVGSGMNTDVAKMTDEEVVAFAKEHPDAFRGRAGMQSESTRRYQDVTRREQELEIQEQQVQDRMATVQATQAQYAGVTPDASNDPSVMSRLQSASTPEEFERVLGNVIDGRVQTANAGITEDMQRMQVQQAASAIQRGFTELEEVYPEVGRSNVRERVERQMQEMGTMDPETAYLKLLAPKLRERQMAANQAARDARAETVIPGAPQRGARGQQIEGVAEMTPQQKVAAALRLTDQLPDGSFVSSNDDAATPVPEGFKATADD